MATSNGRPVAKARTNKDGTITNATPNNPSTIQTPVAPATIPSATPTPTPAIKENPINRFTGLPAGATPQTETPNPAPTQYETTKTSEVPDNIVFGNDAKQQNALDATYLDRRDDMIAGQIVNQLNTITKGGQTIDGSTYDQVLSDIVQNNGGVIDYNSPDWLNTIDRINSKILGKTGASDINSFYKNLNSGLDKINTYQTGDALYSAIQGGNVSKSQLDLIKNTRPDLYQQYTDYQDTQFKLALINDKPMSSSDLIADQIDINTLFTKVGLDMTSSTDIDLMSKRMELMGSEQMRVAQSSYFKAKADYEALNDTMKNIEAEVRSQYEGQGATESYIQAKIAQRSKELAPKIQSTQRELMIRQEEYNLEIGNVNDSMETLLQQNTIDTQNEKLKMDKFSLLYGVAQDTQKRNDELKLADIEYQRSIQNLQIQAEIEYQQSVKLAKLDSGDINSADTFIQSKAIEKNVDSLMVQYDGLISSSRDQLVERIKNDMKAGKSYGDALASIMTDIRNKPEYKYYMNAKIGIDNTPKSLGGNLYAVSDGKGGYIVKTQAQIETSNSPSVISQITQAMQQERALSGSSQYDNYDFVNQILSGQLKTRSGTVCLPGQTGGQCGAFVNDMMGISGFMGSTLDSKINRTKDPQRNSPVPVVGGVVVLDNGSTYTDANGNKINAGHTGIVTAVYANGSFDYVDSNGIAGKEKIGVNKGKTVTSKMYFTKAKDRQSPSSMVTGGSSSGNFNPNLAWLYEKGSPTQADLKSAGLTAEQYGQQKNAYQKANAGTTVLTDDQRTVFNSQISSFRSNPAIKQFEDAMTQYSNIKSSLENPSGPGDISAIFMFMKSLDPASVVRESEFNTAASSAGVSGKISNALSRLQNGETLTNTQRDAFVSLAKKFIENRAIQYDRLYGDMERVVVGQGINASLLPSRASKGVTVTASEKLLANQLLEQGLQNMTPVKKTAGSGRL